MTDAAALAGIAARRSALYWLLADIVLTCPERAFVERLQAELQAAPGEETPIALRLAAMRSALPQPDDAAGVERLAVEYTRLFGGLREGYGPPPPFESMQFVGYEASESMESAINAYAEAGFDLSERGIAPDHLGVELRFMSMLCHREMQAWRGERSTEAMETLARQRDFMRRHLEPWAPQYWTRAVAGARHDFYRAAATIALDAASEDPALVEELLA